MARLKKTLSVQLTNADATVLAASATVTRYIRGVHATNITASPVTWNWGVGANLTAGANADVFGETIAANSRANPLYYGGQGRQVVNTALRAFASANTAVNLTIDYDEEDLQ